MRMKTTALTLFMLVSFTAAGQGVLLTAGDTFSYSFDTMPYLGRFTVPGGAGSAAEGSFNTSFEGDLFDPSDSVRLEIFERSLDDAPRQSSTFGGYTTSVSSLSILAPYAWSDFQGAVRLTVLSGSVELTKISVYRENPVTLQRYDLYGMVVPIPEPYPSSLLLAVALVGSLRLCARKCCLGQ